MLKDYHSYDKKDNLFREVIGIQMATVRISVSDLLPDAAISF